MSIMHFSNPSMVAESEPSTFSQIDAIQTGSFTRFAVDADMAKTTKDRVIISNQDYDTPNVDEGAAHVFLRVGEDWILEQTIGPPVSAANTAFGTSVTMSGDGSRVVVTQGAPAAQATVHVYDRIGTTWSFTETITTTYATGILTNQVNLSSDGLTLITKNNSTTGIVQFFRWSGTAFVLQFTATEAVATGTFGESTGISEDGKLVAISRRGVGFIVTYEDPTGTGVWAVRGSGSGATDVASRPRDINISNDGQIVSYSNDDLLNTWEWTGALYAKITNDLITGLNTAGALSSDATKVAVLLSANAVTETYIGTGAVPYVSDVTRTPDDPSSAGTTMVMSYDGSLILVGNAAWKVANGQQGRAFTFEV